MMLGLDFGKYKVQLTKSAKFVSRHSKLFITPMKIVRGVAVSNDISVHQKHLRILAIEVCKSLIETNSDFMWDFYTIKPVLHDLRTDEKLYLPTINTIRYGLNSQIFRGS